MNNIYYYRIIFTYMIVIFHFDNGYRIFNCVNERMTFAGYLAVEFFFITSGFLLYRAVKKKKYSSAIDYTIGRYKKLYSKYLLAFIAVFIAVCYHKKNLLEPLPLLWDSKWEILLLQSLDFHRGWNMINPTLWYISVLIIVGCFLYFAIDKMEKFFFSVLGPVIIIGFTLFFWFNLGKLDAVIDYPLFRGLLEMTIGIYGAKLNEFIQEKKTGLGKWNIDIPAFCAVICFILFKGYGKTDFIVLLLMFVMIVFGFLPKENREDKHIFIKKCSQLTIDVYLIHELFRSHVISYICPVTEDLREKFIALLIYLFMVTLGALILEMTDQLLKKLCKGISFGN